MPDNLRKNEQKKLPTNFEGWGLAAKREIRHFYISFSLQLMTKRILLNFPANSRHGKQIQLKDMKIVICGLIFEHKEYISQI